MPSIPPTWKYCMALPHSSVPPIAGCAAEFVSTTTPLPSVLFSGADSLLRGSPPLCSAFVRSSSWVLHLDFSVCIAAPGSHVPHSCLLTDSGHLNDGCRSVRKQVSSELIPQ